MKLTEKLDQVLQSEENIILSKLINYIQLSSDLYNARMFMDKYELATPEERERSVQTKGVDIYQQAHNETEERINTLDKLSKELFGDLTKVAMKSIFKKN